MIALAASGLRGTLGQPAAALATLECKFAREHAIRSAALRASRLKESQTWR